MALLLAVFFDEAPLRDLRTKLRELLLGDSRRALAARNARLLRQALDAQNLTSRRNATR
jgi:hypothetical protein